MVWKADSTFDASSADVSIKDNPFSAAENTFIQYPLRQYSRDTKLT